MDKKFYITTLGCPKNTADSMSMHHSLLEEGFTPAAFAEESDFHFINTCTFIRSATEETIQTILSAAQVKKQNHQKLVVVGCFAERYPDNIGSEIPEVDLFFGTGKYGQAGKILREKFPDLSPPKREFNEDILERWKLSTGIENYSKPYAYVKVSDGCNRGCSFCIIPSFRGKFRESPLEDILRDTDRAIRAGAKEICLVSQDTVYYGRDSEVLLDMVRRVSEIDTLEILRLLYLYPDKNRKVDPPYGRNQEDRAVFGISFTTRIFQNSEVYESSRGEFRFQGSIRFGERGETRSRNSDFVYHRLSRRGTGRRGSGLTVHRRNETGKGESIFLFSAGRNERGGVETNRSRKGKIETNQSDSGCALGDFGGDSRISYW